MKKIKILLTLFFAGTSLASFSQERVKKIEFGLQAGWSVSRISGDTFDSKSGFIGGLTATIPISNSFSIQPEVNFQQQGGKYKGTYYIGDMGFSKAQLNMSYLNVPVLLKYRFVPIHLSIYAGPQIGFKLSAKENIDGGTFNFDNDNVKKTDFSGVYGLEYAFPLPDTHGSLVVNARYISGFTNFMKDVSYLPQSSYHNNGYAITIGFRF